MGRSRGRKGVRTKEMISIAHERIERLFGLAREEAGRKNYPRANRYAELAGKISTRYNVRIPGRYKLEFCRKCHAYLVPGLNSRVRLNNGKRLVHCNSCGWEYRIPYKRLRSSRRATA